jgi:CBS domain-containing protein
MRVDDQMTRRIVSCGLLDDLATAASRLWENDCGSLPVLDERGHVAGMLTDRDICMAAMFTGKALGELRVAAVMTRDVATAREHDTLHDAEMILRSRSVHRLPVVDDHQRVVGILTANDLLRWVDEGGRSDTNQDAVHLVRTLAGVSRRRLPFQPAPASPGTRLQPVIRTARR